MNVPSRLNEANVLTRASLLARLRNWKDDQSWQRFFDSYWGLLYRFSLASGLSEADAEEVVQETVIIVAGKIKTFQYDPGRGHFSSWLFRIVRNRVYKQLTRTSRLREAALDGKDAASWLEGIPDPATLEPDALWQEEWEWNLMAVATQRAKQRSNRKEYQLYDYHVNQGHSLAPVKHDVA